MAKIQEEIVIIKLSRLVKGDDKDLGDVMATSDVLSAIEQVAQELVAAGVVVEVDVG